MGDRRYSVSGVGYGADGEILLNNRPSDLPMLRATGMPAGRSFVQ